MTSLLTHPSSTDTRKSPISSLTASIYSLRRFFRNFKKTDKMKRKKGTKKFLIDPFSIKSITVSVQSISNSIDNMFSQ